MHGEVTTPNQPCRSENGDKLVLCHFGTLCTKSEVGYRNSEVGGRMSKFGSWKSEVQSKSDSGDCALVNARKHKAPQSILSLNIKRHQKGIFGVFSVT